MDGGHLPIYCSLRSGGVWLTYLLFSRGKQFLPIVLIGRDSVNVGEETLHKCDYILTSIVNLQLNAQLCGVSKGICFHRTKIFGLTITGDRSYRQIWIKREKVRYFSSD